MNCKFYIWTTLILLVGCNTNNTDYEKIASYQDNSVIPLETSVDENTRVLLIFPHADDEITCVGLASYLKEKYPPDHPILPNSHPRLIFVENNFDEVTRKNVCSGSSLARERNG
ncbi:hypothetical protein G3O08_20450, partial [Cryomorpha ignava]